MRYSRQNCILELIGKYEIETQEMLLLLLKENGFEVTQATISRDIKELQLAKVLSSSGKYVYAVPGMGDSPVTDRFERIFKDTVISIKQAHNIILVKTLSGCAAAAGEAIDSSKLTHIVGTVAGDNTFMVVVDEEENVPEILEKFDEMISK